MRDFNEFLENRVEEGGLLWQSQCQCVQPGSDKARVTVPQYPHRPVSQGTQGGGMQVRHTA